MKRIEFGELHVTPLMRQLINECLDSEKLTLGPRVKQLEEKFAAQVGAKYCVATNSGTSADIIACAVMAEIDQVPRGGEVICPALGFIAYANAILACGLTPKFVDVELNTLNIDVNKIEEAITDNVYGILAVSTMGKPADFKTLREICNRNQLFLIGDQCEAHLSRHHNKYIEEYADICTYSGYVAHLCVSGEFGWLTTNDERLVPLLKSVRSHGRDGDSLYFNHDRFGLNMKPTDLHACIGLASVDDMQNIFKIRKNNWYYLTEKCQFLKDIAYLSEESVEDCNCPHGFSVTTKEKTTHQIISLQHYLDKYNIHWKRNFGCIPTQHKAFEWMGYKLGVFPMSEQIGNCGIHIGCHQYMTQEDLERIVECFQEWYKDTI